MARISEIARVRTAGLPPGSDQTVQDAFLLWKSVTSECERKNIGMLSGKYVYRNPLINHVSRLWPTLSHDELVGKSRELYLYLRDSGNARCVSPQNPTVWHISPSWQQVDVKTRTVFRMTARERRLSAHEAGEDIPPQRVTTRTKEQPQVTTEQSDTEVRRELIVLALEGTKQPLVSEEIAFATGLEKSQVRKELKVLVSQKRIAARVETLEERKTRFGGTARASRAGLFSLTSPVPERTEREIVKGFVKELAPQERQMSSHELNRRLGCRINKMGVRSRFTAASLADSSGVALGSLRARIREMEGAGLVEMVGHQGSARQYRIKNKEKLLDMLEFQPTLPEPTAPLATTTVPVPVLVPSPPATLGNPLARIAEVLDENGRLREQNARLQARVAELESAVDTEALQRLAAWTPSV